ncbi:MAG: UbiA family prenyltransferase [Myxococcales bacterium]|nr:UbiA family prenyltransferase [Myxococcales bacterium]
MMFVIFAYRGFWGEIATISRVHILLVAVIASIVFGWLMGGDYLWAAAFFCGLDWFLINLLNRVTDVDEDTRNNIAGTGYIARHKTGFVGLGFGLMLTSFVVNLFWFRELVLWRLLVQAIGMGYNYRIVWTPRGWSRFKELYFAKNFGSSVLFVLTCFVYPLVLLGYDPQVPFSYIAVLVLFFVPFELTYEILYDVRDLDGDRAAGVPTYPVVHGLKTTRHILDGLLAGSALVLVVGVAAGVIGIREGLMIVAPTVQWGFYRRRWGQSLTSSDCVLLTHVGSAQLVIFLLGTALWEWVGFPANIFLG